MGKEGRSGTSHRGAPQPHVGRRLEMRSKVLMVLALALALVAIALGAFELWLRADAGRDFLRARLEALFEREIRGSLRIGGIDRYSFGAVEAHDVDFLDPRGEPVIQLPHVEVGIDVGALFSRTVRLENARAKRGVVIIAKGQQDMSTSIEEAFAGGRSDDDDDSPDFDIETGTIHVDRTALVIDMGKPRVRIEGLEGFVRVSRTGDQKVKVRLDRFAGAWRLPGTVLFDEPHPFHASARIDGNVDPLVDLTVRACFPRGEVPARLRYGKDTGARISFDAEEQRLVGLVLRALDLFVGNVEAERATVDVSHLEPCD